jgi:hypothetical protein
VRGRINYLRTRTNSHLYELFFDCCKCDDSITIFLINIYYPNAPLPWTLFWTPRHFTVNRRISVALENLFWLIIMVIWNSEILRTPDFQIYCCFNCLTEISGFSTSGGKILHSYSALSRTGLYFSALLWIYFFLIIKTVLCVFGQSTSALISAQQVN